MARPSARSPRLRVVKVPHPDNRRVTKVVIRAVGGLGRAEMSVGPAWGLDFGSPVLTSEAVRRQDKRTWAHLEWLHVTRKGRGRRIGSVLLERAIAVARKMGAEGISLEALATWDDHGALVQSELMSFYERHGFGMYDPENPAAYYRHMVMDLRPKGSRAKLSPGLSRTRKDRWSGWSRRKQLESRSRWIAQDDAGARKWRTGHARVRENPDLPHLVEVVVDPVRGGRWQIRPIVTPTAGGPSSSLRLPPHVGLGLPIRLLFAAREVAEAEAIELGLQLLGESAAHVVVRRGTQVLASYGPDTDRWEAMGIAERPRPVPIGLTRGEDRFEIQYGSRHIPIPADPGDTVEAFLRAGDLFLLYYDLDLDRVGLVVYDLNQNTMVEQVEIDDPETIAYVMEGDPEGIASARAAVNLFDYALERGGRP